MMGGERMVVAASPTALRALLKRYGLEPKKGLGQHFLWQARLVERIADAAELTEKDLVLEIGPGTGNLTAALARRAGMVVAVEIDRSLFPLLKETLAGLENVRLVAGDARSVDYRELLESCAPGFTGPCKVLGNLPYYITSPLIMRLLGQGFRKELLVFMVQKEVADRIAASPGGKEYGSLSVAVQYYAEPEVLFRVPPDAFFPPPDVASAVVRLRCRSRPAVEVRDEGLFFEVVHAAFRYRRKTIKNALREAGLLVPERESRFFAEVRIDPGRRGETFGLKEFALMADALFEMRERKEQ
jgi:16S rRNA (adenine1518-N6/adenine1519-N6)-dimethyltransferase